MITKFTFLLACLAFVALNSTAQFSSVTALEPLPIANNTADKPQSKVWIHAGQHWAVLPDADGTHVWRLDGTRWTKIVTIYGSSYAKADCKVVGNVTHILLFRGKSTSYIASVEYDATSNTYVLWKTRSSRAAIKFDDGVETATMDIDGNGRMWIASDAVSDINIRWSDPPYSNWSGPITVASGILSDDICSLIALPGKVGVFWSNQNAKRFGFKTHANGSDPTAWSADEVPASQSALNLKYGMADDHINLAAASDGTLYCAVKTGYETSNYPKVALLVRRSSGTWDNLYAVTTDIGTRPIVVLNEVKEKIKVVYTSQEGGGDILYKESSTSSISFGSQNTLIRGDYNYPTSLKDTYNPSVVVLASTNTQAVGIIGSDGNSVTPPTPPALVSPQNQATGVSNSPTLTWDASSGADIYQVQVSSVSDFSSIVFDQSGIQETSVQVSNLLHGTTYYWRVLASNSAGNSGWSSEWNFKTTSAPNETLVGNWNMEEGSGNTLLDATSYGNNASLIGGPTWVSGVSGLAIRFDGSSQYATVPDNSSLDVTNAVTLAAWIKPEKSGSAQVIMKKGLTGESDGYELSLVSNGKIFFRINQLTNGETYRLNSSVTHPTDGVTWMHIAASFDGSTIRLYINGKENKAVSFSSPVSIISNSLPLGIGAQSNGGNRYQGALDDLRVYNRALSASEISGLAGMPAISESKMERLYTQQGPKLQESMLIYPNPFASKAAINFSLEAGGDYALTLYDSKGAEVSRLEEGTAVPGESKTVDIDGTHLPNGLYLVKLQTSGGFKTATVIINK